MLIIPPIPARRYRKARPQNPPPPAAPPVLAAAELTFGAGDDAFVRLSFDRAIDAAGLAPAQVTVDDAAGAGWAYAGSAVAALPDPQTVVLSLVQTGGAEGPTRLNATAATGIVAADDGGAWGGATDLELPYP